MLMEDPSSSHQVLLSYRAEDTCAAFTDHLYTALIQAGIQTLKQGIDYRDWKVSVIVLTEGYALSQSCLEQLDVIIKGKEKLDRSILPVFYDVDPSDIRKHKGRIGEALALHEQKCGREKVERWKQALAEIADFGGMVLQNQADG